MLSSNVLLIEGDDARMRKIKSVVAALAVIVGALGALGAPTAASAAASVPGNVYTYNSLTLCHSSCSQSGGSWVEMRTYATYSRSQVWINGHVSCSSGGDWIVTWCGVGGGNGTAELNIGANFGSPPGGEDYVRMNIIQNGAGCYSWGYAPSPWNWTITCERRA
jgi:hypothetical protein